LYTLKPQIDSIVTKVIQVISFINLNIKWQVWPFSVAVLLATMVINNRSGNAEWLPMLVLLAKYTCLIFPIVLYKQWACSDDQKLRFGVITWLLVFIGYPLLLLIIDNTINPLPDNSTFDFSFFIYIWCTEALLIINVWLQGRPKTNYKHKLTLDKSLFAISVIFSFFWAFIFISTDDPVNNQPLEFVFEFDLLFSNLGQFLSYALQFQITYGLVFIFYYIHRHLLVNKVLDKHGFFHYLWLTALFLLVYYPIGNQLVLYLPMNNGEHTLIASGNHNPFDYDNAWVALALLLVSLPIILALQWSQKSQEISELAKENIHTELLLLQQQINPHFLFNTLNNIYALCLTKSAQAPELVQQLADLLRFVVYKGDQDKVLLTEEVEYLQGYLNLQQVRVSNKCQFDVEFCHPLADVEIAPLLLVILLENAFKHGVEPTDQAAWLTVKLYVEGNMLHFICANSVTDNYQVEQSRTTHNTDGVEYVGGLGLENLRRRLTLLYGNKHQLKINHQKNAYSVHLTLECQ